LAQAKEESAALIEETFEKLREKERVTNQRDSKKALDILGFPKEKKAKEILGLNDEEFSESIRNRQERQEEWYENIRQSQDAVVFSRMVESTKFIPTGNVAKVGRKKEKKYYVIILFCNLFIYLFIYFFFFKGKKIAWTFKK